MDFVVFISSRIIAIESKSTFKSSSRSIESFRTKYKPYKIIVAFKDKSKDDQQKSASAVLIEFIGGVVAEHHKT